MRKLVPVLLAAAATLVGCGPYNRSGARDEAARVACDWYEKCGDIGSGQTYADRDACLTDIKADFQNYWDDPRCDEIERDDLDICLSAIKATQCDNGFDWLNTVLNKCSIDTVCGAQ